MTLMLRNLALTALFALLAAATPGQVATGTPPFGSSSTGPADTVDLANLDVHLDIPVVRKAGRGLPFTYDLGYDNSIWYPVTSGSTTSWQPVQNWGWIAQTEGTTGSLSFWTYIVCYQGIGCAEALYSFVYLDPFGVPHPVNLAFGNGGWICNGVEFHTFPASCQSADGAGFTLIVNNTYPPTFAVITPTGKTIIPPVDTNTGTAGETDSNGNEISVSSSGVFTDTLGQTALTIAGSGTPSSPTTLTYTAPSSAPAAFTMNYTNYTVATNFGVSGIGEYKSSAAVPLVTSIVLPDGSQYTFTYESTPSTPASGACTPYAGTTCVTGRLTSVKLPTQGTITYAYSGGNNGILADGTTATLKRTTPDTGSSNWIYAHSENGTAWTTTITAPTYNSQNNQTVMNFQGIYPTETQIYQGSSTGGTLLRTTYTCYNGSAPPCNSTAVTLPITTTATYTLWPGGLMSEVNAVYDEETCGNYNCSNGLLKEKDEYAYGNGSPGPLARKTLIAYASLGNNIVGKPSQVTVQDGSGNVKAQTTYQYDQTSVVPTNNTPQHVAPTGSRGNLTTASWLTSGSTFLSKTFTYFDTGRVQYAYDVNNAETQYNYPDPNSTCGNAFPTSVNEPLGYTVSMTWNCTGAVGASVTDENGNTVSASYNDSYFWRPHSSTDELNNTTTLSYTNDITVESTLNFNGTTSTSDILATVDTLGRPILSQTKESQTSSAYDSVETSYDSLGRPYATTLPYGANAGGTCSGTCPGSTTQYDALGRATSVAFGSGVNDTATTTYTYVANDVEQTLGPAPSGENTKSKQLEYDGLGRLTSVCEVTSASGSGTCGQTSHATGFWTEYSYDVLGDLTSVTQNAQSSPTQSRSYTYDALGRMTKAVDPESGTTNYTYDTDATCGTSTGDLVKKVDAAGNVTCYTYDQLHDLLTATVNSGPYASVTPIKTFVYGPSSSSVTVDGVVMANAKTRLAEAYTCSSPCSTKITDEGFSYTARGELATLYESTPHSAGWYTSTATYWANGALETLNDSAGYALSFGVDGEGRPYSSTDGSGGHPLLSTNYSVASLPTQLTFGYTGDSDTYSYDQYTNRMTQYKFTVNDQSDTGNVNWNPNGTLGSLLITDQFNPNDTQSCAYSHDDLARIASDNCGSGWSQTFTYDAFGNITKNGSSPFGPMYTRNPPTNQYSSIGGSSPSYDANGNVTNDFLNTYSWDANGRPLTVANSAGSVSVTYDALGSVVEQNRGGAYTQILYAPTGFKLSLMNGQSYTKEFAPMPGGGASVWTPSTFYYRHGDWLGSSRFASTKSRTMYYDGAYGPFGESYAETGTTDRNFTGMDQDTTSTVYDFPAREYGEIQGRWPSPDPSGLASANPSDPQTWNRYAYVRNSPLMITDPTGLDPEPGPGCDPSDPSCPGAPPCTGYYCGPGILPDPGGPVLTFAGSFAPPPTTGLPNGGIFATGPGVDYSWFGLLDWALGFAPVGGNNITGCSSSAGLPVPCTTPGAIDCNNGVGLDGIPTVQVPDVCYEAYPQHAMVPGWKPRHSGKYSDFLTCENGYIIDKAIGDDERAGIFTAVNVAPFAPKKLLKGSKWVYAFIAWLYDESILVAANQTCTEQVYK
jgi:RHS repeat-associated protein